MGLKLSRARHTGTIDVVNLLHQENEKLANLFKKLNIQKVNFIVLGNSIAAGYNFTGKIIPLLNRNPFLFKLLKEQSIDVKLYNYVRPETNNNENILSWIVNNQTIAEVYEILKYSYFSEGSTL